MAGTVHVLRLVHMALAILGIHVAFNSLQNLATSILPGSLGFWVMGTQAIMFCLFAVLVAPTVVNKLGPKWALVVSSACYVVLMASTLYPTTWLMLPAAAIMGGGAGILWTSQGVYLTYAAANYAAANGQKRESAMGYFTGIFFGVFQGNMIIGALIASGLMTLLQDKDGTVPASVITILLYVYIAIAVLSTIAVAFLGNEEPPRTESVDWTTSAPQAKTVGETISSFFLLLRDKRILLMIACMMYSGIEQGFIFVNFTGDIIKPILGTRAIGWVMAGFGGMNVLSSLVFGKIADRFGPSPIVIIGWLSHVTFLIVYYLFYGAGVLPVSWIAENPWFLYVSVAFYSIGDAGWQFFPSTMIGMMFTDDAEAGFANMKFWQSLGNTLMSIVGAYIAFEYKVIWSFSMLSVAIICLVILNNYVVRIDAGKSTKSVNSGEQAELLHG